MHLQIRLWQRRECVLIMKKRHTSSITRIPIRKDLVSDGHIKKTRADDTLSARYLVCSKEGVKEKHSTHETRKEQACTRTYCKARVQFHITPAGVWMIQKAIIEHNHHMVSPDKAHMLRSQRQLLDVDKHMINHMRSAGIQPSKIYNYFEE